MTLSTVGRYQSSHVQQEGEHAAVVGGSLAGLLAARVLADGYDTVTIIEKDSLPDDPRSRPGVPQGPQIHALQEAGRATLEDFFPGFGEDIISAGGLLIDGASDFKFYDEGGFLADGTKRFPMYFATRPLFEHVIRRRVTSFENVELRTECQFMDYLFDSETMTVEGIAIREGSDQKRIAADLVVDATGRTSRTPTWLDNHGFDAPDIDEAVISFSVNRTTIEEADVPPEDIKLVLNRNGEWTELETDLVGEDEDNFYFQATADGLDVFAITAEGAATKIQTPTPEQRDGFTPEEDNGAAAGLEESDDDSSGVFDGLGILAVSVVTVGGIALAARRYI
jgi:hypothetical protein